MSYLYTSVKKVSKLLFSLITLLLVSLVSFSQLSFTNPVLTSGVDHEPGAIYRFNNVSAGIDALLKIDSTINGSTILSIDDLGFGYDRAFQPQIKSGGSGTSYAVFTISFVSSLTGLPITFPVLNSTFLDIDGNNTSNEFADLTANNSIPSLLSPVPQVAIQKNDNTAIGRNISGIEVGGIDTSTKEVMFSVASTNVSSMTVRFGIVSSNSSKQTRQYSLYYKTFALAGTLPVTLISFQATLRDKNASLNWITTNHTNFSHFVVEKSTDGKNFKQTAVLFADEISSTTNEYKYKDNLQNSTSKVVYYRLKMVDVDQIYSYSETRLVRMAVEENKVQISTFPNPVTNEVRVLVPAEWQEKAVTYEIYNSNGILVQRLQNQKAAQVQQMNVQQLNSGNYIVKVSNGTATSTSKIVKIN